MSRLWHFLTGVLKNSKFPFQTLERPTSLFYSYKQDTHTDRNTVYTHLCCTHYAWISCSTVRLYCSPVSAHLYCKLVLTNESPSRITFMNRVDQSQLRFFNVTITTFWSLITACWPRKKIFESTNYDHCKNYIPYHGNKALPGIKTWRISVIVDII